MSFGDALDVLYEDNHLVAVNKPCGWPSAHYTGAEETMDRVVKAYLKEKYHKAGNVFLGVVHRIDKPTSGVLLFARTSKAAARLSEQFRDNLVEKTYWAVVDDRVAGKPPPPPLEPAGTMEDWLRKDPVRGGIRVVDPSAVLAKQALLHYVVKAEHDGLSFLEIRPQTGRTHQLRVQLASRGRPIYGDSKYGSRFAFGPGIALHSQSVTFLHPTRYEPLTVTAEVPRSWLGRFAHLLQKPE
jgi:23S rRNA pseudouridine1911/1915/1917 synthase